MTKLRVTVSLSLILSLCVVSDLSWAKNWNTKSKDKPKDILDVLVDESIASDKKTIQRFQIQLTQLGFDIESRDGTLNGDTKLALSDFVKQFTFNKGVILNETLIEQINRVHHGRFSSPFSSTILAKPPIFSSTNWIATTDIRKDVPDCEDCRVTTFMLTSGDMDGDGIDEIVLGTHRQDPNWRAVNESSPLKIISLKNGKAKLDQILALTQVPSRVHEREALIRDFNGDGQGDLFVASHGLDAKPFPGEQNILILSTPQGHINVSRSNLPLLDDMAHGVDAGDIDGDGDLDLFVITNEGSENIIPYILINDGYGRFTKQNITTVSEKSLFDFTKRNRKHRAQYSTVRFADLNQDGAVDILLLARGEAPHEVDKFKGTKNSLVIYNDGLGQFPIENLTELPNGRWGFGTFTNDAEVLDLNGDGRLDLILTQSTREANGGAWRGHYLQVLINDGNRFVDQSSETLWPQGYGDNISEFAFADKTTLSDIDGDGDLDIVTRSLGPTFKDDDKAMIVQIGINDGSGVFVATNPKWFQDVRPHQGRSPIAGDFNGDQVTDIATYRLNHIPSNDQTVGIHLFVQTD